MRKIFREAKEILLQIRDDVKDLKESIQLLAIASKEVLTIKDVALVTGYQESYIYKLSSQGNSNMPVYAPIEGGKLFFKKEELFEWLLSKKKKTAIDFENTITNCLTANIQ